MRDLEEAKSRLDERGLALTIVKNSRIVFETRSKGITGFLDAIEKLGNKLQGASVADRVVGKAIALLCAHAKIRAVYAKLLSQNARLVLEEYGIHHEWTELVENILDPRKNSSCPFESLVSQVSKPIDSYRMLRALQDSFRKRANN